MYFENMTLGEGFTTHFDIVSLFNSMEKTSWVSMQKCKQSMLYPLWKKETR